MKWAMNGQPSTQHQDEAVIEGTANPAISCWIFNREWTPIDAKEVKIIWEHDLL